jgi:hypothetical protein
MCVHYDCSGGIAGRSIAPKAAGDLFKLDTGICVSSGDIRAPDSKSLQRPTHIDRKFQSHCSEQAPSSG